ncbi:MAG TPA: sulfotransferase, partial [Acidimicrobiia bacterium]|nr:sulfotransferase [Acidimicrobiia bacterium]
MKNVYRIADLREPRRDAREQAIYDFACSLEIDVSVEGVVDAATQTTGLDHFDDPTVLDRLRAQVDAVNADGGLSGLGRLVVRQRLEGLLRARLRFDEFVRRYPEAIDVDLEPPVIVVGLPRSGTTHLVNLLAADTRFRSLPWWECGEPVPVLGDGPGPDGVDPRYLRSKAEWEAGKEAAPLVQYMHDRPPWSIEEDCELVDLDLCSYTLEWHARVPQWRDTYLALDQRPHYAFLRRELQVLSFLRGPRRWVLKTPQHLEQLPVLMDTFPDATIALTLRDPVAVLQSAITMLAYGDRLRRTTSDADSLASYWIDRIERLLHAAVRDVGVIPAGQRV